MSEHLMLVQTAPCLISISGIAKQNQTAKFAITKKWSECMIQRLEAGHAFILNISPVNVSHAAYLLGEPGTPPTPVGPDFNVLLPGQFINLGLGRLEPNVAWAVWHN